MELVKPPDDPDLKNIIDRLANFVARNGPEFEQMTKQKQKDNPRFAFLHGGEHYAYYHYKLTTERTVLNANLAPPQQLTTPLPGMLPQTIPPPTIQPPWQSAVLPPTMQSSIPPPVVQPSIVPAIPPPAVVTNISLAQPVPAAVSSVVQAIQLPTTIPQQPSQQQLPALLQQQIKTLEKQIEAQESDAKVQIKQSEQNLSAQFKSLNQQQQAQIEDAILKSREEHLGSLSAECEIGIEDFDKVVQPIIDSCTKDAILNGKTWIFNNCISESHCNLASQYLLMRITAKESTFEMKLHLIYLINDLLHHCQRKNADGLKKALEKVVVPIFCSTSSGIDEDRMNKLKKLLSLWEANKYFSDQTREKMKEPAKGLSEYQAELLSEHKDRVTNITANMQHRYSQLQKQHQEFADHLTLQITQAKAQLEVMKEQLPPEIAAALKETATSQPASTTKVSSEAGDSRSSTPIGEDSPDEDKRKSSDERSSRSPEARDEEQFGNTAFASKSLDVSRQSPFDHSSAGSRPPRSRLSEDPYDQLYDPSYDPSFDSSFDPHFDPAFDHFPDEYPDRFMPHDQPPHPRFGGPRPPGFGRMPHPMEFDYAHGPPRHRMFGPDFRGPPGPNHMQMPDLSKPPPGFPPPGPHHFGPPPDLDLTPAMPYFDLPAGLMVPLVKLEDNEYKPLDPRDIRLPPPMPPSERLLAAVEAFYSPPSHDRPRDAEGWEKMSLYEYYRAKQRALQEKAEHERLNGRPFRRNSPPPRHPHNSMSRSVSHSRSPSRSKSRSRSRSRSPDYRRRKHSRSRSRSASSSRSRSRSGSRSGSRSRSRSDSRSRSVSRSPRRRRRDKRNYSRSRSRSRSKSPSPVRQRARSKSESPLPYLRSSKSRSPSPTRAPVPFRRSRSRSVTPPSFGADPAAVKDPNSMLGQDNKGHQLMMKMGWGGKGLGAAEQGIVEPVSAADVRDKQDMHKGIGVNLKDPFEQFRKNKSAGFIQRMKARDEMREAKSQMIKQQAPNTGGKGK